MAKRDKTDAAELYLDLLKGVLTRLVFDEKVRPLVADRGWKRVAYRNLKRFVLDPTGLVLLRRREVHPETRRRGMDHPLDAETMVGMIRLNNLQECIETVLRDDVPGDILEAGVWRGGSVILAQAVLKVRRATDRKVWVCDSFAGLPKPDPGRYPADAGDRHWQLDHLAVSEGDVRDNFARYGLLDDNVVFLPGLFQDTFPTAPVERLAVLRADADMYESTMTVLQHMYPKVSDGGFVIIDDYGGIPACKAAVHDYRDKEGITEPIELIDWTGAYWRKRASAGT